MVVMVVLVVVGAEVGRKTQHQRRNGGQVRWARAQPSNMMPLAKAMTVKEREEQEQEQEVVGHHAIRGKIRRGQGSGR